MDGASWSFPPGDLRIGDADRDRALSELGEAVRLGRITADEFDERSARALRSRTGSELSAILADLPVPSRPAAASPAVRTAALQRAGRAPLPRVVIGASVAALCFAAVAVNNAMNPDPNLQQRELIQAILARQGVRIPLPPAPGFNWVAMATPAMIAVLLVFLVIVLRTARPGRSAGPGRSCFTGATCAPPR